MMRSTRALFIFCLFSLNQNIVNAEKKVLLFIPDPEAKSKDLLGVEGFLGASLKKLTKTDIHSCQNLSLEPQDLISRSFDLANKVVKYLKNDYKVSILACGKSIAVTAIASQFLNKSKSKVGKKENNNELTFKAKEANASFRLVKKMAILENTFREIKKNNPLVIRSKSQRKHLTPPYIQALYTIKAPDDEMQFTVDMSIVKKVFTFWAQKAPLCKLFGPLPFENLKEKNLFRIQILCKSIKSKFFSFVTKKHVKTFFLRWINYFSDIFLSKNQNITFQDSLKKVDYCITFDKDKPTIFISS